MTIKIEDYSLSVKAKAFRIIKYKQLVQTHDMESCRRFIILPLREELAATIVRFDKRNLTWNCSCKHWGIYADENCQHICACKMWMDDKKLAYNGMLIFDCESKQPIILKEDEDVSKPILVR